MVEVEVEEVVVVVEEEEEVVVVVGVEEVVVVLPYNILVRILVHTSLDKERHIAVLDVFLPYLFENE